MSGLAQGREPSIRQRRTEELLAQELTVILQESVHDPRISGAAVTGVRVSRDLRRATVLVAGSGHLQRLELLRALDHSAPFIRRELGVRAYLRIIPELQFRIDDSLERARRVEELLDQVASDPPEATEPDDE